MAAVQTRNITFRYMGQSHPVLDKISFYLDSGQIAAITGRSGSGKSTLGYCLCGVIPRFIQGEFSGQIKLEGRAGIVFQDPDCQVFLPTVEDELAFGPENLCLPRAEIGKRIGDTLELIGLSERRLDNPHKLSGGEKQLVALGGVLTLDPDVLILDEVLSQLDQFARQRIKEVLLKLKERGKTLIMIEHDRTNMDIADQIWLLGNGRLELLTDVGGASGRA